MLKKEQFRALVAFNEQERCYELTMTVRVKADARREVENYDVAGKQLATSNPRYSVLVLESVKRQAEAVIWRTIYGEELLQKVYEVRRRFEKHPLASFSKAINELAEMLERPQWKDPVNEVNERVAKAKQKKFPLDT